MLRTNVVVAKLKGLAERELQDLLGAWGERDVARWCLLSLTDNLCDLRAHGIERNAKGLKCLGCYALTLVDEAEQDVLGSDVVVVEHPCLFLGKDNHPTGSVSKSLKHVRSSRVLPFDPVGAPRISGWLRYDSSRFKPAESHSYAHVRQRRDCSALRAQHSHRKRAIRPCRCPALDARCSPRRRTWLA